VPSDDEPSAESTPSMRTRAQRWTIRIAIALVSVALGWLLLINLMLWTGAIEAIVSAERPRSTVRLEHGRAWCIWPTRVHVEDLYLAIDAERWQLELHLPKGEVDVDLHELLWRRFETSWIRGQHGDLTFSLKKPHGTDPEAVQTYAQIEGMPLPILDEEPRPVPEADKAWEVAIHDVDADLDRLKVNGFQADLEAQLAGAVDVRVTQHFALPYLTLDIEQAEIHHADALVAEGVRGLVDLTLDEYDPSEIKGKKALRMLSGRIAITANVAPLEWTRTLNKDLPVELHRGDGTLACEVNLLEGELLEGTRVLYETERVQAVMPRDKGDAIWADLAAHLEVEVHRSEASDSAHASATLRQLRVGMGTQDLAPVLTAPRLTLEAQSTKCDLVEGIGELAAASFDLPRFTAPDLGTLGDVSKKIGLHSGQLVGHASAHTKKGNPEEFALDFGTDIEELGISLGDSNRLRTDGYVRSKGTLSLEGGELKLSPLHAKLQNVRMKTKKGETSEDWLEVDRAEIRYRRKDGRMSAEVRGRLVDLRSVLAHLRPGKDLFERVPDLGMGTDPISYALSFTRSGPRTQIDITHFEGSPIDIRASLSKTPKETRGVVYFRRANVGLLTNGGSRDIEVAVDQAWFEARKKWVSGN